MAFQNKSLRCSDCKRDFVFSAEEQQFFAAKELVNEPKRCFNCRILNRAQREGKGVANTSEVFCAICNAVTRVPFQPNGHKPVYCMSCFRAKKMEEETVNEDSLTTGSL